LRKMHKSIIAAALVGMLSVTSACSSSNTPSGSNADSGKDNTASTVKLDPNVPGWESDTSPITFDWYVNFSWFTHKWGDDLVSQNITKKTGVNVNLMVPAGNENEKMQTMIASGKLPDFITLNVTDDAVKKMVDGKLVLPLNELSDQYEPYFINHLDPGKVNWFKEADGNLYGYPSDSQTPEDYVKNPVPRATKQTFIVRKDMYEALGKPDMRTPEGFLNAIIAAKEKFPEVDGQPLIPLNFHDFSEKGNYTFDDILPNFLAIPHQKDGKLYDRTTDPEYLRWMKTFRKANELGLIAKDVFIDKRPQVEEKTMQGRYFAMLYAVADIETQNRNVYLKDPDKIYIAIDGPANTQMAEPTLPGPDVSGWTLTLISKDVKDKKRAIQFLSYLASDEGQRDLCLGVKGVTYDTIDGKDQFMDEYLNNPKEGVKYGAKYLFPMVMDTNMWLKWAPEDPEPYLTNYNWSRGTSKVHNFSEFKQLQPQGNSPEGIIATKAQQLWGKTLPKLLLSKSDAEMEELFAKFYQDRDKLGYDKVVAYQQAKYEENKKRLGIQ